METIYRSENLCALYNSGAATGVRRPRLVTFEGLGKVTTQGLNLTHPFGYALAGSLRIDIIHVVPRGAHWYQYPDTYDCLAEVRKYLAPETIAYGSSMGGYAVARFSDRLGVSTGVSVSPQASVQNWINEWDDRWMRFAEQIDFLSDDRLQRRDARVWVFTDTDHPGERYHAELIASAGPTEVINVAGVGHPVGGVRINGTVLAKLVIKAFLEGRASVAAFDAMVSTRDREQAPKIGGGNP